MPGLATHIEFENTWNHDDGVRPICVLEHCKTKGLGTIDEESAAEAALVPNNPVPSTVLADEQGAKFSNSKKAWLVSCGCPCSYQVS